jgi:hypothetical protein
MEWFLLILAVTIFFLYVHSQLSNSNQKKRNDGENDPVLEEISAFIDSSLKGYPDRIRHKDINRGGYAWTCHSRLFTFRIHLRKHRLRYQFQIVFFCDLPFRFTIRRSRIARSKLTHRSRKITAQLLARKELHALIQKLRFFDSVSVTRTGVTGTKMFNGISGLSEWHKTLGASITFVRFLLNYEERKQPSQQDEALCPYCKARIAENEQAVSCSTCSTVHHQDCWNETDRCSVFGCGNKSELQL